LDLGPDIVPIPAKGSRRPQGEAGAGPAHIVSGAIRRRFSEDAKRRIVEEVSQTGVSVTRVAKPTRSPPAAVPLALGARPRAGCDDDVPAVRMADGDEPAAEPHTADGPCAARIVVERPIAGIEIELIGGRRVRFDRVVDAETMSRVV